jgi:putative hydrolase of the HAD superfamily
MTQAFFISFKSMSRQHPIYGLRSPSTFRGREWWKATVAATFAKAIPDQSPLTQVQIDMLFRRIYQEFACPETYMLLPDAARFFEKFKNIVKGSESSSPLITLGITTNAPLRTVETILPLLNCHRNFDWSVTAEDVAREKPHRDIFAKALEMARMKDPSIKPDEVLHIGDHFVNDYCGAKSFGFKALYLDRDSTPGSMPDYDALMKKYSDNQDKFGESCHLSLKLDEIEKETIRQLDESLRFI